MRVLAHDHLAVEGELAALRGDAAEHFARHGFGRRVIDLGEHVVGLHAVGDAGGAELAARRAAGELDEQRGARGVAAERHAAQAIVGALADVGHQRVEHARGVGAVLHAHVIELRAGPQRQIEGGIDRRHPRHPTRQVPLDEVQTRIAAGVHLHAGIGRAAAAAARGHEDQFDVRRRRVVRQLDVQHLIAARRIDARQREIDAGGGEIRIEHRREGIARFACIEQSRCEAVGAPWMRASRRNGRRRTPSVRSRAAAAGSSSDGSAGATGSRIDARLRQRAQVGVAPVLVAIGGQRAAETSGDLEHPVVAALLELERQRLVAGLRRCGRAPARAPGRAPRDRADAGSG